jgi:hypothetical protein
VRLFKLLEGLYAELKTFNENVKYFSLIETEVRRNKENPVRVLGEKEKAHLKQWINNRLEAANINPNDLFAEPHVVKKINNFLRYENDLGGIRARKIISEALSYDSFSDLIDAWRKEKVGVA